MNNDNLRHLNDPLKFGKALWPGAEFYDKQREIIYSVRDAEETLVPAGNMLGKDYVTGFICLSFFIRPQMYFDPRYVAEGESRKSKYDPYPHTVRIVTTSVKDEHLDVLWAEIGKFVRTCRFPLVSNKGGPLVMNHHEIKYAREADQKNPTSYLKGMVSKESEGLAGHHAAYTLAVADEASGVKEDAHVEMTRWCKRFLAIGNPNMCNNFFYKGVKAGDKLAI